MANDIMKFWNSNRKTIVAFALFVVGYYLLSSSFGFPALPAFMTRVWIANISIMTVAAALTIFGGFMLLMYY